MTKKHIVLILLLCFIVQNNIFSMRKDIDKGNYNKELNIIDMPNEILLEIIQRIIELYIIDWNGITGWQIAKDKIITDLMNLFLTCTHFLKFNNKASIVYAINNMPIFLKLKIYKFIENKKLKTIELIKILDEIEIDEENWQRVINLMDHGINVNSKNSNGSTALIRVAFYNYQDVAKLLIASGANVNAKNNNGNTALMLAAYSGHKEIVELLIESGADINTKNIYSETALIWAAVYGHKEIVQLLINKNAYVDARCDFADTALIWAAEKGYKDIVELLIVSGADINAKNNIGNTALMLAINYGHKDITKLLIDSGAIIDIKDDIKLEKYLLNIW